MENWGLISFREDRIIFDEKIASTYQKQKLKTISHELAHFCKFNLILNHQYNRLKIFRVWKLCYM